jgi:ATP-binding cassette subfamily B protein
VKQLTLIIHLLRWFAGNPIALSIVIICILIEMGFNSFIPIAFSKLIDDGITARNSAAMANILVLLGIATLVAMAVGMLADYTHAKMFTQVVARIRQRLYEHLQQLSSSYFLKNSAGDISARFSTDMAAVEHTFQTWLPWGWKPVFDMIGYNCVMFWVDWRLALFAQLVWPMSLLGPRIFAPKARGAAELRKQREADVLNSVDEATSGRYVVRAFGLEDFMRKRFAEKLKSLAATALRGAFFTAALERSSSIGIYLLQIGILAFGGSMAFSGTITLGGLVAFYTVFTSFSASLYYLAQYSGSIINSAAGLTRIEQILNEQSTLPEIRFAPELPPFNEQIDFKNVSYGIDGHRRILKNITLTIRHHEFVAIVGPSGAGKSLLVQAMMRMFDPVEGSVEIDGHDLRQVTRASITRHSAVVFQESFLFNTSVRENVRLGRLNASEFEIKAACREAGLHDDIMAMPQGYDSPVGEKGAYLSGGQKQRVAIARALVRNPRILFLDEATSSLDPGTELEIFETLERVRRSRTVIAVTHRLALAARCDRVIVIKAGKLAEQGTHADLLRLNGVYTTLWRRQHPPV